MVRISMGPILRYTALSVIGVISSTTVNTQEPIPFFYGTMSEATVPGTSSALTSYWSLCFDQAGNALWDVDGHPVTGQLHSFDGKRLCIEWETGEDCFEVRADYASARLKGIITINHDGWERYFTVVKDDISQCRLGAVS
ncbi:MAG: hypothetical protein AAFQ87_21235 [Bacteroidota bacterium]